MTPLPAVVYYHTDVWRKNNDMINAAENIKHDKKKPCKRREPDAIENSANSYH